MRHSRWTTPAVLAAVALAWLPALADGKANKRDAAMLKQKVATINERADKPSKIARKITVTDTEVNSYLVYEAKDQIPVGVVEPTITAVGPGRLSGRAIVDLDAVRKQKAPTSLLDPMNYLMGRLAVTAGGKLNTANGVGRFELESSSVGSLPIPKILLQEIISYYSRSAEKPSGISLDDPFQLPANTREIQVDGGKAIIVQ